MERYYCLDCTALVQLGTHGHCIHCDSPSVVYHDTVTPNHLDATVRYEVSDKVLV